MTDWHLLKQQSCLLHGQQAARLLLLPHSYDSQCSLHYVTGSAK